MREIKFRGKSVDNGEWIEGFLGVKMSIQTGSDESFIIKQEYTPATDRCYFIDIQVISETVGQYTRLKDEKSNKIYEGDIIKAYKHYEDEFIGEVKFYNGCFMFLTWNWHEFLNKFRNIKVIGNIYDNPELLTT